MKPMRWDAFPDDDPLLSGCFVLTLVAAVSGVPLGVFCFFWKLQNDAWVVWMGPPAFGHGMALIWLLFARSWAQEQGKRLGEIPERSVEQAYHHRDLENQRGGIRTVLWGTVAGSWVAMIAGWVLARFLS